MSVLVWWTVLLKGRVKGVRLGNVNWRRSVLSFPIVDEGRISKATFILYDGKYRKVRGDTAGSNMVKGCVRNESSPGVMRDQVCELTFCIQTKRKAIVRVGNGDVQVGCGNLDVQYG
ncbi:hypothetical protein V6N13_020510 [Hibiscus sabdariffa]